MHMLLIIFAVGQVCLTTALDKVYKNQLKPFLDAANNGSSLESVAGSDVLRVLNPPGNDCSTCVKIGEKPGIPDPKCGNMGSCSYNSAPGKCVVYKGEGTVKYKKEFGSRASKVVFRMCEQVKKEETVTCTPYSLTNGQEANYLHIFQELKKLTLFTGVESIRFEGERCVENSASLLMIDIFKTLCLIFIALFVTFC